MKYEPGDLDKKWPWSDNPDKNLSLIWTCANYDDFHSVEPSHLQIIVEKISNRPIGLNPECAFTIYFARVESNPDHGHFAK